VRRLVSTQRFCHSFPCGRRFDFAIFFSKHPKPLAQFADPQKPYYSLLHPMWSTHYGTYDHLARVQEWSLIGGSKDRDA